MEENQNNSIKSNPAEGEELKPASDSTPLNENGTNDDTNAPTVEIDHVEVSVQENVASAPKVKDNSPAEERYDTDDVINSAIDSPISENDIMANDTSELERYSLYKPDDDERKEAEEAGDAVPEIEIIEAATKRTVINIITKNSTRLDVSAMNATHIIDVLKGAYDAETQSNIRGLQKVVELVEGNVVALSLSKGQPFSTGLMIASDLLITARHTIEGVDIDSICVRAGYQITNVCKSFGTNIHLVSVLEENLYLDYAICKLAEPIKNYVDLEFSEKMATNVIFIHHPNGCSKRISVHESLAFNELEVNHSSFRDSYMGSTVAFCFDSHGAVVALHSTFPNGKTTATLMSGILHSSRVLGFLVLARKEGINSPSTTQKFTSTYCAPKTFLDASNYRQDKVCPGTLPELPPPMELYEQDYYRIIPDGSMQFLWMLGKECPKIRSTLVNLCYECEQRNHVDSLRWAPWNMFIGPARHYREDTPKHVVEKYRPHSFDKELWDTIHNLNAEIEKCWELRVNLLDPAVKSIKMDSVHSENRRVNQYIKKLNHVSRALRDIEVLYKRIVKTHGKNYIHQTVISDWHTTSHGTKVTIRHDMFETIGNLMRRNPNSNI